jgi:hypothetical protein
MPGGQVPTAAYKRRPRHTPSGLELPRTDGRTIAAKRFRQLCEAFTTELGGQLSEVDQNLVKQAANLVLAAERFQLDVVSGATVDSDALVRVSSEARRILGMLRSKTAKNKPAGPTLADYVARKVAEKQFATWRRLQWRQRCAGISRRASWPASASAPRRSAQRAWRTPSPITRQRGWRHSGSPLAARQRSPVGHAPGLSNPLRLILVGRIEL